MPLLPLLLCKILFPPPPPLPFLPRLPPLALLHLPLHLPLCPLSNLLLLLRQPRRALILCFPLERLALDVARADAEGFTEARHFGLFGEGDRVRVGRARTRREEVGLREELGAQFEHGVFDRCFF